MKFPEYKGVSYPQIADEIAEFWKDNSVFEQSIAVREGKPSFTFYEGPPSANGQPGIHHVMARTIKDIFCRYKTLQGFQVKRKGGWDTHGLPIELQVEKELGITKDDIGKKISIEDYNKKCREAVMRFTDVWQNMTDKMGYWVDMEKPYVTYKNEYIETVWHLLKKFYDKGLLYKGFTIQPYSPAAGTGLSSHELNQPGCYKDVKDTSIVAMFELKENFNAQFLNPETLKEAHKNTYVLAWTTTPWTLPSNSALTVGAGISYAFVKTFNPYTHEPVNVILAKDLVGKYFTAKGLEVSFDDFERSDKKIIPYKILSEIKGSALVGTAYNQLIDAVNHNPAGELYENTNAFKIIAGDFVTTEDGTGVVHTSPTFGADDFKVAMQNNVPPIMVADEIGKDIPTVDKKGRFIPAIGTWINQKAKLHGIKTHKEISADEYYVKNYTDEDEKQENYKNTDEILSIILKSEGKAFKVEKYEHTYPHCWRTDKPVLYYPLDSWFIRTTALKDRLSELNKTINWAPESTGTGRFGNWLDNLVDWNLSRSRYWGTPLPIWRTEDGSSEICIGSVQELVSNLESANNSGKLSEQQKAGNLKFIAGYSSRDKSVPYSALTPNPSPEEMGVGDDSSKSSFADHVYTTDPATWLNKLKTYARENRKNQTPAEEILWQEIRNKKLDFKFRRQHAIGNYIADFVCISEKLAIEVDGEIHDLPNNKNYDRVREEYLRNEGFRVIRFKNQEVFDNTEDVLITIKTALQESSSEGAKITPLSTGEGQGERSDKKPKINSTFDLHRPYVDEIFLVSESGEVMTRETDLIDVWFDSGAMPYAQWHYPFSQDSLENVFPADFISEGVDQTRGWFFTLHAIAGMLFDTVAFKNVVSTGLVLDKNGNKMSKRLGNTVDPFETLNKYGADPTRWYMITNAEPWDNLKFNLEGIGEVQRKFFGTLTNTYNFFALYANLDNYKIEQFNRVPKENLSELDRWIISKVFTLGKLVSQEFDNYNPTKAGRLIQDFVCDDLSNWYVRLNRRRFWQGELTQDKKAAYETLQHCLVAVAQFMSPIAPFYADWLYRNLTNGVRQESIDKNTPFKDISVHFSTWHSYEEYWVDPDLEHTMELAQRTCSLVHALRKKHSLKVRQPLNKILIPGHNAVISKQISHVSDIICSEVNIKTIEFLDDDSGVLKKKVKPNFKALGPKYGKDMKAVADVIQNMSAENLKKLENTGNIQISNFSIDLSDVEILTEDIPGWLVATDNELTVALDITLTTELKHEGIARDFVNRVQNYRKDNGFEVTDKIAIKLLNNHDELAEAITNFKDYISQEVQANSLDIVEKIDNASELEMDEFMLHLNIAKA